jgi:hypothetical protein
MFAAWLSSARLAYGLAALLPAGQALMESSVELPANVLAFAGNALVRVAVLSFLAFLVARTARQERELKILHGLLPICMFCKRIRDDQEGWQRLETYIARHSEADFTHGLCPECAREHYGVSLENAPNDPPAASPK